MAPQGKTSRSAPKTSRKRGNRPGNNKETPNSRTDGGDVLPPVLPVDIIDVDDDGDLICRPSERRLGNNKTKRDQNAKTPTILIPEKLALAEKPAPGIGNRFLVRLARDPAARQRPRVFVQELIRKVGKERERLLAVMDVSRGGAIARPVDR